MTATLNFLKLDGTTSAKLQLNAAANGVVLKNNSANLDVRNAADSAYATVNVAETVLHGTTYNVGLLPSASAVATYNLTMPVDAGTTGFVLATDGTGTLSWVPSASGATDTTIMTPLSFGDGSTVTSFTLPTGGIIMSMEMIVDTAFDGTANASIGITSDHSMFMGVGDMNLQISAGWNNFPNVAPAVAPEVVTIYYAAGGATVGAARLIINYSVPL
jgi:hypothetical protein